MKYVVDRLDSTWISSKGCYIEKSEHQFASYTGSAFATTVNNGTAALHLALMALGSGKGKMVFAPDFTYIATPNAVKYTQAPPVFADVLPHNWQIGPSHRAILPGLISNADKYCFTPIVKQSCSRQSSKAWASPPVEAMRFGKPVFASTLSGIPEVSGDYAYYWDNFDPAYMAGFFEKHMYEFYNTPALPEKLRQHSLKYTWDENARILVQLFRSVLFTKSS